MICRVWPKSYIAVSTNAALDGLIQEKHIGWGCWYLRKNKSIADHHHLLPDSFKKISVLASFYRDTNLITFYRDTNHRGRIVVQWCCINWCSREIPPVTITGSNTNQPAHKNLGQILKEDPIFAQVFNFSQAGGSPPALGGSIPIRAVLEHLCIPSWLLSEMANTAPDGFFSFSFPCQILQLTNPMSHLSTKTNPKVSPR